jgi:hypothetical protein
MNLKARFARLQLRCGQFKTGQNVNQRNTFRILCPCSITQEFHLGKNVSYSFHFTFQSFHEASYKVDQSQLIVREGVACCLILPVTGNQVYSRDNQ